MIDKKQNNTMKKNMIKKDNFETLEAVERERERERESYSLFNMENI